MRFDGLHELSSLHVDWLETLFHDEPVLAVLPVSEHGSGRSSVLVALPHMLGVMTLRLVAGRSRWETRWAPWGAVRLPSLRSATAASRARTAVDVDDRLFDGVLGGERGRVALREFARAVRRRRQALDSTTHVPA